MDAMTYAVRLQRMIACRTVSYKDHFEPEEFFKLRTVMEDLFPLVHQRMERSVFGADCWIYRLRGRDSARAILLMSHHDVVPAVGAWTHEPFGEIADGKLWGRGTVDTKTPLFAIFSAVEELLAEGFVPPCDLYLGSSHNEEVAGDGIPLAKAYFEAQGITFEVILDEGGAVIDSPIGGMRCEKCAMVAVHEKGKYYLVCTAEDGDGHAGLNASIRRSPVERMASFIHTITEKPPFVRRLNDQVWAMLEHLAPDCSFPMKAVFSNLGLFGGGLTRIMPKLSPQAGGLLGTTASFHEIRADRERNCCTAVAVLRPVDRKDLETDLASFRAVAEEFGISVRVREDSEYHEPADMTRPQFAYTMDQIRRTFPDIPAAPMILPAGTDARTLTPLCPCVLRFAPIRLSAQQLSSVHGTDENIDLDAIPTAVTFYKQFLSNYR